MVIPARYASSRLPGKPLRDVAGKPLIQHVYERGQASGADEVVVATDDERIRQAAIAFGAPVCMTSTEHQSGTDRLAEVARLNNYDDGQIIVNLQGDEPLIPVSLLRQVAANLASHHDTSVATLREPISVPDLLFDPNVVKVVTDKAGYALYFSRAPIPWDRERFAQQRKSLSQNISHYRHIGLYAYRGAFLKEYSDWRPCTLEQAESLEQLRVLWNGYRIHVGIAVEPTTAGVDTEADLARVSETLSQS